jgi:glycosyltransferase involved in cell wall biosynthesis
MMAEPKVTVYISSHNYGKYLLDAIESVLRQTVDFWELLIIDDASTDNTPSIIKLYQGDERIRTFRTDGIGLPAVCNLALAEAHGEYIIRLDGDDFFDENILLVLCHHLDANPDHALVFPDNYLVDERNTIFLHERRHKLFDANHMADIPPNGACTLVRRSVLAELGGYRVDLGAQDGFDIWSKIAGRYKCGNINLPLFCYRRHGKNLTERQQFIMSARRQIKYDAVRDEIDTFRPIMAVIPCRKNYDFLPDLWKLPIGDSSMLQIAIRNCLASRFFDQVIVACDNPEVEAVLDTYDDPRLMFFQRQAKNTIRSVKLAHALEQVVACTDPAKSGVTVLRYIQSPFVTTQTMEEALFTLIMNAVDAAIGVEEILRPVFRRMPHGLELLNPQREFSTEFDTIYQEANTAFASRNANFATGSLTGSRIVNFTVSPNECFFINSELTLEIARIMEAKR